MKCSKSEFDHCYSDLGTAGINLQLKKHKSLYISSLIDEKKMFDISFK